MRSCEGLIEIREVRSVLAESLERRQRALRMELRQVVLEVSRRALGVICLVALEHLANKDRAWFGNSSAAGAHGGWREVVGLMPHLAGALVAELDEPRPQLTVYGLRAHQRLVRRLQLGRMEQERERLGAAHSAVRSDELLERGHLVGVLPVGAVHHDVRAVREAVRAP